MEKQILQGLGAEIKFENDVFYFVEIEPKKISLLDVNANIMGRETFQKLCKNIKKDNALSSVPLCYVDLIESRIIVISGNHRVKASVENGLEKIVVLVFKKTPSKDDILRLQLSHNAIHGIDDKKILEQLLSEFSDVENSLLSGISGDYLKSLPKIEFIDIDGLEYENKTITLAYNSIQMQEIKEIVENLKEAKKDCASEMMYAEVTHDEMNEVRDFVHKSKNVINISLALLIALRVARAFKENNENIDEIFDDEVPIRINTKTGNIRKDTSKKILRALKRYNGDFEKMMSEAIELLEARDG